MIQIIIYIKTQKIVNLIENSAERQNVMLRIIKLYIEHIIKINKKCCVVNFLQEIKENTYQWAQKTDSAEVKSCYIFLKTFDSYR